MADNVPTPCPLCLGPLVSADKLKIVCADEGHSYGPDELIKAQESHIARALWNAVRALEDGAAGAKWIAANDPKQAVHQLPKAEAAMADAGRIRALIKGSAFTGN